MVSKVIENRSGVGLGVLPTHLTFMGGLVPDEGGRLPRNGDGKLAVLAGMEELQRVCAVAVSAVQISCFPGANEGDMDELFEGVKGLGLELQNVMMVSGLNPMDGRDEDAVVAQLMENLEVAMRHGISQVNTTSVEAWMATPAPVDEGDYEARLAQVVRLHARVYREAGLAGSCVEGWNIEFLRPGEFNTFTSLRRLNEVLTRLNAEVGTVFFRALCDAAHCADSGLSMGEHEELVKEMAAVDHLGPFHASAKTTRGCLSTDDGWVGMMMSAMARAGKLSQVFVEVFHHEDEALEELRRLVPGHGVDTRDGRSYVEVVSDGLVEVTRRLNNLKARGIL